MAGNLQPNGCGKVSYWCRFWTGDALQLTRGLFWNEVTWQKRIWFLNDGCVSNAIWNDPILYLVLPDGWLCDFSVTVASRHSGILPGTLCHACVAGRAFSVRQIVGQEVPRCRADSHFDPDSWVNFVSQGCRGLSLIHLRNRTANDDSKRSIERLLLGVWQGFRTKSATWFQGSTLTPKIGQNSPIHLTHDTSVPQLKLWRHLKCIQAKYFKAMHSANGQNGQVIWLGKHTLKSSNFSRHNDASSYQWISWCRRFRSTSMVGSMVTGKYCKQLKTDVVQGDWFAGSSVLHHWVDPSQSIHDTLAVLTPAHVKVGCLWMTGAMSLASYINVPKGLKLMCYKWMLCQIPWPYKRMSIQLD